MAAGGGGGAGSGDVRGGGLCVWCGRCCGFLETQPYPPHGSAVVDAKNKRYLPSGGIFRIDGSVKRPNGQEEVFYFQCKLA
ncbi:hypothetical protein KGA66_10735 [Actinocrinis puniceicyclus]|uniref:Uncharacterized protein n=1 Tax=Actinocrinis puniceicyclus TaxID=977794 RepID=A0A8J7WPA7_9ACTN|nr:hypothetical protein [Actinocrinis puniceicyclus]MBS2963524.1 hypothetical protein [Actinocrinis puniceicyclus]